MGNAFTVNHVSFMLQGAAWTLGIALIGLLGGAIFGFAVALSRISPYRGLRWLSLAYVQLVQGTPLLILMFLCYFGVGAFGLDLPPLAAVSIAMTVYVSAYLGEIWRGALEAVPRTQWEAAECLALSRTQRLFLVILPQALQLATPPTVGFMVQAVKNSSLASVVGFIELTRAGQIVNNSLFEPLQVFTLMALIYFMLCFPLSILSRKLERTMHVARRVPSPI